MANKHPPKEDKMADYRSQSSLIPSHTPALPSTKTTTNSKGIHTDASDTTGIKSSTANSSQPTMVGVSGSPKDIICGRGLHILSHHGNHKLHLIVDMYRQAYLTSTRKEKADITKRIVGELKSTGARFLRRFNDNGDGSCWVEVDDKTAYKKVGHALRLRKNDHGHNFLQPNHGQQVDHQRSLTPLHSTARSETETGTGRPVVAVPNGPEKSMLHVSRLSSSPSVVLQLPLALPENQLQVATQSQIVSQPSVRTQPESIVPWSVAGGQRNIVIDPQLHSQVFTNTVALMTQMQHQPHSTFNTIFADIDRSTKSPNEKKRGIL